MDWSHTLTIIATNIAILGTNFTLLIWARNDASADRRQFKIQADADRQEMLQVMRDIRDEMKDFHDKLYSLKKEK